jgi:hypothetical protein
MRNREKVRASGNENTQTTTLIFIPNHLPSLQKQSENFSKNRQDYADVCSKNKRFSRNTIYRFVSDLFCPRLNLPAQACGCTDRYTLTRKTSRASTERIGIGPNLLQTHRLADDTFR